MVRPAVSVKARASQRTPRSPPIVPAAAPGVVEVPGRILDTTRQNEGGSMDLSRRPASDANTSTRFSHDRSTSEAGTPPSCARTIAGAEVVKPSGAANVYGAADSAVAGALRSTARGAGLSSTVAVRSRQARS